MSKRKKSGVLFRAVNLFVKFVSALIQGKDCKILKTKDHKILKLKLSVAALKSK